MENKKIFIITEKPSQARDIAKTLGGFKENKEYFENDNFVLSWAIGHIVTLFEPEDYDKKYKFWSLKALPIIPTPFKLKIVDSMERRYQTLLKFIKDKNIKEIVNACDAGREGELIFRNIVELSQSAKPVKRLWLSAMTHSAIEEGFSNLRESKEFDNLGMAAKARQEADWLIGINATRGLTVKNKTLVSVGRVQTPVLSLIVQREKEIKDFIPEDYFEIYADFIPSEDKKRLYKGQWFKKGEDRTYKKEEAESIVKSVEGKTGIISSIQDKETRQSPPLLFDLATLQREANISFGYTAQKTLNIAQSLYEAKRLITYPRTDSRYLPKAIFNILPKILKGLLNTQYRNVLSIIDKEKRKIRGYLINDSKVTDHYAIIPTGEKYEISSLKPEELNIYNMVVARFLSQFFEDAIFNVTKVITEVKSHTFKSEGKVLKEKGWFIVEPYKEKDISLPELQENENVLAESSEIEKKQTKPPPRYTDATLIQAMETAGKFIEEEELKEALKEKGIGTPATRAAIIERIIEVGYVKREKRNLVPLDKGIKLIELLNSIPIDEITSPQLTGEWEMTLREIEKGKKSSDEFMKDIISLVGVVTLKIKDYKEKKSIGISSEEPLGNCPKCGRKVYETPRAYQCEGVKDKLCDFSIGKIFLRKEIKREDVEKLLHDKETDFIDGFISKNKKRFKAKIVFKDNKISLEFENENKKEEKPINEEVLGRCPVCKSHVKEGKTSYFCTNSECSFRVLKKLGGKEISTSILKKLLEEKKTELIEDFVSKYGKPFSAYLVLDSGKVKFEFLNLRVGSLKKRQKTSKKKQKTLKKKKE